MTVAIFPYYSPYQFINKRKVPQGIFIDYLRLLEDKIDYTFVKKQYDDWPMVLEDAKHDQIDIILEAQKTDDRSDYLVFSDILFESEFVIVTRKGADFGKTIESLYGRSVVLPNGYSVEDIMKSHAGSIKFYNKADDIECLKSVNSGEYEAFVGPKAVVNHIIKTSKLTHLKISGSIGDTYQPSIAVRKNNPILASILNKAVANVSQAEKERLMKNWLYDYEKPYYQKIWFWIYVVGILGILIALATYFNYHLKQVVNKRRLELRASKNLLNNDTALKIDFIREASKSYESPFGKISSIANQLNQEDGSIPQNLIDEIIENADTLVENLDSHLKIKASKNPFTAATVKTVQKSKIEVLLVDDVTINLLVLEKLLSGIGCFEFTFHKASNGKMAVDYCKANSDLDLVFMDIRMPVMDGYEATKAIKAMRPNLPIVVQTAFVSAQDKERAFAAGCNAYITKPINVTDLKNVISKFYQPQD